jgi:hypothetical protein
MSISFQSDIAAIKTMIHYIVKSVYESRLSFTELKQVDNEFVNKYDKDDINKSVQSMLSDVRIVVMSKLE